MREIDDAAFERLQKLLAAAHSRAQHSVNEAERLLTGGFAEPALVWAVRGVEIYFREFLLAPLLLDEHEDDWIAALRAAGKILGSGNWTKAYKRLESFTGPLDAMVTDFGGDAWAHWKNRAVGLRGDVVHGNWLGEPRGVSGEDARWAIAYARQLMTQLTLRVIVTREHPAADLLVEALRRYAATSEVPGGSGEAEPPADSPMA